MRMAACGMSLTAILALPLATVPAVAQDATPEPSLTLDLNALQPSDKGGCRLTFVVTNNLPTPVDRAAEETESPTVDASRAAYEMALFDKQGVVDRLTVLDFKDMPAGKTKVSRFDLAGTDCAGISRVLINDATGCTGEGTDAKACMTSLKTTSTSGVQFGR